MKYAGMPMGMWVLFAGSFQKQLTAYDLSFVVVVLQNNHYKAQIVSGQLLLKRAGKQHPHPHGHPGIFHCLSPNPIFTICIFIPLSPTLARNRKKPLTEGSFRSL